MPDIALLATGGTIAGRRLGVAVDAVCNSNELVQKIYSSNCLPADINLRDKNVMCDLSEDMNPQKWGKIAEDVAKAANEGFNGVVITHGTYTMAYTAAALSFMLKNLSIPVIMTGAQKLLTEPDSDGIGNLSASVILASNKEAPAKVLVVFSASPEEVSRYFKIFLEKNVSGSPKTVKHNEKGHFIFSGCRVKKIHARREDAFQSYLPFGCIRNGGEILLSNNVRKCRIQNTEGVVADTRIENKVALIKSFPGICPEIIDMYIDNGYKGIIIEGYGDGIVSTKEQYDFCTSIKNANDRGIGVFMTSQTIGNVTLLDYIGGPKLRDAGAVPLGDMTTECAVVKLMWALGHCEDLSEVQKLIEVQKLMHEDICGEITPRSWEQDNS